VPPGFADEQRRARLGQHVVHPFVGQREVQEHRVVPRQDQPPERREPLRAGVHRDGREFFPAAEAEAARQVRGVRLRLNPVFRKSNRDLFPVRKIQRGRDVARGAGQAEQGGEGHVFPERITALENRTSLLHAPYLLFQDSIASV